MAGFLPPVVAVLTADIAEYKAKMDEAKGEMGAFDEESKGMGAGTKAAFLGLATVIAGVGYESVKLATTFDATMTRINSQDNANLTTQQMNNLKSSVLSLAGPVAQTPEALAEAMIHVYGSGLKGAQALEVLKIAGEGASVGNANLTDVTNALDAAIAINIPGVQNYSQAMGELNATVGAGDMTMQNLADALGGPMLATVKGYGLNITDVGAALAVYGDRNIRGAEAATELRMAVQALAVPAASGKKALASLGLSTTTLRDDLQKGGLKQALNDLYDRLLKAGYTTKTAGAMITEMFGKKAGGGLNVLMDSLSSSTSNFNDKFALVAKTGKTFSTSWAQTQDTLAFKIRSLGDGLESLAIRLGNRLIPYVSQFLGWILKGSAWISQHKAVIAVLAGILAGVLVSALYAAVAATIAWTMALDVNPIFLVITAIAGLVGGLIYAYQHFASFRNIVDEVGRFLRSVFADAWRAVGAVVRWFVDNPIKYVKQRLDDFKAFWKSHGEEIMTIMRHVWTVISTILHVYVDIMTGVLKTWLTAVKAIWKFVWDWVKGYIKLVWDYVRDTFTTAFHLILNLVGVFADLFTGHWSKLWQDVKHLVHQLFNDIGAVVSDFAKNAINMLWQAGKDVIQGLINGVKSMIGNATDMVKNVGSSIVHGFTSFFGIGSPSRLFHSYGQYMVQGLVNGIASMHGAAKDASRGLGEAVTGGFNPGSLNGTGIGGGVSSGGGMIVVVNVQGSVHAAADLATTVRQEILRYNQRNSRSNLSLAGYGR